MHKYTSTFQRNQREKFEAARLAMQEAALTRSRVVIKTSADDEIRFTWCKPYQPFGKHAAGGALPDSDALERSSLDYKHDSRLLTVAHLDPHSAYGAKGITKYGRRTIREGCAVMEQKYAKSIAFLTLTLPGSTKEALDAFAANSSEILDAYFQRVRKHFSIKERKSRGEIFAEEIEDDRVIDYVGPWEPQQRGALHLHVAVGMHDEAMFDELRKMHKRWWCKLLKTYSEKTGVDLFKRAQGGSWRNKWRYVQTDCVMVQKSVKRYMSKYMTKGHANGEVLPFATPKRWWVMSRELRREVIAQRRSEVFMFDDIADAVEDVAAAMECIRGETQATFAMENPFNGEIVGYQMYFEQGAKTAIYEHLRSLFGTEVGREVLQSIREKLARPPDIPVAKIAA